MIRCSRIIRITVFTGSDQGLGIGQDKAFFKLFLRLLSHLFTQQHAGLSPFAVFDLSQYLLGQPLFGDCLWWQGGSQGEGRQMQFGRRENLQRGFVLGEK